MPIGPSSAASLEMIPTKANLMGSNDALSPAESNVPATTSQTQNQNVVKQFQINDRVRIAAKKEVCVVLQAGHGGWNPRIESV